MGRTRQPKRSTETPVPVPVVAATGPPSPEIGINSQRLEIIGVLIVFVAVLLLLAAYFTSRGGGVDEVGLFNPAYVDLHYGKVAYPIYGDFDVMVVHPPLHYKIIGELMRLGIAYYYAEATPALLMLLLGVLLTAASPFSRAVKIGLLCGLAGPIAVLSVVDVELFGMRPESHLQAAWFAGLIALESGRQSNWNWKWLCGGAFLVAYASGLHYYAAPALLGIAVYMFWAVRQLGWRGARRPLLFITAGGLLFGIPYLLFFLIPEWNQILAMLRSVPYQGIREILRTHIDLYRQLAASRAGGIWLQFPLTYGIPLVLISIPILLAIPCARGLALASLPLQLFVLVFAGHKHVYYFVHEISIYCFALATGAAVLAEKLLSRISHSPRVQRMMLTAAAAILGAGMLLAKWDAKHTSIRPAERIQEAEIARAAGKEMLGPNARVGSRIIPWYSSGAAHWYNVSWDLFWKPLPEHYEVASYAAYFDAFAESAHMSGSNTNGRDVTLSSWYADGTLHLSGFFFSEGNQDLSYVLLKGTPAESMNGFALRNTQLYRFQEDSSGDYEVESLVCPSDRLNDYRALALFSSWLELPHSKVDPTQRVIITALIPPDGPRSYASAHPDCRVVRETRGVLLFSDAKTLVSKMRREDRPIMFYRHFTDLPAANAANSP